MKKYVCHIEIEGPIAMFARPDTGATPTSYPIPTWSAAKGIFESIAFLADGKAWFSPNRVQVCKRVTETGGEINFQRMTMNYGGPLRKNDLFTKGIVYGGSSMQLAATVAVNVCFRIEAEVKGGFQQGFNPRHYLKHLFERRLRQGRCWRTPILGWSEFTCSYWGPFRTTKTKDNTGDWVENKLWKTHCDEMGISFDDLTEVDTGVSIAIPSLLGSVWGEPVSGAYSPQFSTEMRIENGLLFYTEDLAHA